MYVPRVIMWDILRRLAATAIQRLAIDAQDLRCRRDIALRVSKNPGDVARFEVVETEELAAERTGVSACDGFGKQKIAWIDDRIRRQRQCTFDQVLELPHVPWKRIAHQVLQRFLRDAHILEAFTF